MLRHIRRLLGMDKPAPAPQPGQAYVNLPFVNRDAPQVGEMSPGHNTFFEADARSYLALPDPIANIMAPVAYREGQALSTPPPYRERFNAPDFAPLFGLYMHTLGDHEIQDTDRKPFEPQIPLLPATPWEPETAFDRADRSEVIYSP